MLGQQLQTDLISAMKAKDESLTGTLRLLLASVKNKQIELGHDLTDEEFLAIVGKEVKQRQDSIAQFTANDRADLAASEQVELDILKQYLPEQMDADQISAEVDKTIAQTGASAPADMGKVMGALAHLKGQADMGQVSSLVRQKLSA